jgi:hypothetical protein
MRHNSCGNSDAWLVCILSQTALPESNASSSWYKGVTDEGVDSLQGITRVISATGPPLEAGRRLQGEKKFYRSITMTVEARRFVMF